MLDIAPQVFPGFNDASSKALILAHMDHISNESRPEKCFDTVTGEGMTMDPEKKLRAPQGRPLHIMQTLKLPNLIA